MSAHPEWCTQDMRCTALHVTGGEHASPPEIWETQVGRIIATRYQTGSGHLAGQGWLEIRAVLTLPAAEAAAQEQARHLIAAVFAAITGTGQPAPKPGNAKARPVLLITRGLPGCGKTTIARRWVAGGADRVRISRDDLRDMLHHRRRDPHAEQHVTHAAHSAAKTLLRQRVSVVFDETNLPHPHYQRLLDLAEQEGALPVTVDLRHIPLAVCLRRNALRHGPARVPEQIIRAMHARHIAPVLEGQPA